MARITNAMLLDRIATLEAALASRPAAPVKAATKSISTLRSEGAFACGVKGHGKADDGKFATIGGATFHAKTCPAMAKALAK
jgi:hypothetical protein